MTRSDAVYAPEHVREIVMAHVGREGALLPILNDVQAAYSYIPRDAIPLIAEMLNLTRAEVFGVVSFYHDYRDARAGQHVIEVCRAEACQAMGGRELADRVLELVGADWHHTSADGAVTLEAVYCLGQCAVAPALMVDDKVYGRVSSAKAEALVAGCRR